MSWDVMLLNLGGRPPRIDLLETDFNPPPLGSAQDVRDRISSSAPRVDWRDTTRGRLVSETWSIEFVLGNEEVVKSVMLRVRGGGDPVSLITKLCSANGWSAFDLSAGDFIDPEDLSSAAWEDFQRFRDGAIGP